MNVTKITRGEETTFHNLPVAVAEEPPRISPQARALWMTIRQALLMAVAGIEVYLGIRK